MKRLFHSLLLLSALGHSLACSPAGPPPTITPAESLGELCPQVVVGPVTLFRRSHVDDNSAKGTTVFPLLNGVTAGSYESEILRALGKPLRHSTVRNTCEPTIVEAQIRYSGLCIDLVGDEGEPWAFNFVVTDPGWVFSNGLRTGLSYDAVLAILGTPVAEAFGPGMVTSEAYFGMDPDPDYKGAAETVRLAFRQCTVVEIQLSIMGGC